MGILAIVKSEKISQIRNQKFNCNKPTNEIKKTFVSCFGIKSAIPQYKLNIFPDHPKNWIKNGVNFRYAIKMMIDFHVTIV